MRKEPRAKQAFGGFSDWLYIYGEQDAANNTGKRANNPDQGAVHEEDAHDLAARSADGAENGDLPPFALH